MQQPLDFDHNATAPLLPAARQAVLAALDAGLGNPSSAHGRGQAARAVVDRARAQVAAALGVRPVEVVFTSGATEANVLAWRGVLATQPRPAAAVTTTVEHPSVLAVAAQLQAEGVTVHRVGVDGEGRLDRAAMAAALALPDVRLLSVMAVNNELGTRMPVAELASIARRHGALVHCDATQAIGREPMDLRDLDLLSLSGHKLGAPPGVGVLWVRRGVRLQAVQGGHQEQGLRAGTENVPGIAGLGASLAELPERLAAAERVRALRDRLWRELREVPGVRRNGDVAAAQECGNTLNVAFGGVAGPALLMALDLEDVHASAGAACASGSLEPSHVLRALGGQAAARAREAVRFSLGPQHTEADVDRVAALVPVLVARIRGARS